MTANKFWGTLSLLLVLLCSGQSVFAAELRSNISADSDPRSLFPSTNFNSTSHMYALKSATNTARLHMKADLSGIPSNATINQAYVIFKQYTPDTCFGEPDGNYLSVGLAASDWSETTLNWNNKPLIVDSSTAYFPCMGNQYIALVAQTQIQKIVSGERPNYGFVIYGNESAGNWQRTIYARESGGLNISYVYVVYTLPVANPPAGQSEPSTPDSTSDTTTTQSGSAGTSTGSNAAPAKVTSNKISAPSNLTAADASTSDAPKSILAWEKSSTVAVDGYKIFRSINGSDFVNIAQTDKNTVTYSDKLEFGQTYTYKLRSYKGNEESVDSNVVTFVTIPKPEVLENIKPNDQPSTPLARLLNFLRINKLVLIVVAASIIILAALATVLYLHRRKKLLKK